MVHDRTYAVADLVGYVNWAYFLHAWHMPQNNHAATGETRNLQADARRVLDRLADSMVIRTRVAVLPANADSDDIVLCLDDETELRLPMLRQQTPDAEGYCRCLADYVMPKKKNERDTVGVFATSVASSVPPCQTGDDYELLLRQTLCDRLAEAAAERLHEEVRTKLWGYAPAEQLSMAELHAEKFQGIRPAVGYPSLPDMSLNFLLDAVLDFSQIGVRLTEHGMMQPHASVSGLMLAHPQARYFAVGRISEEQLADYARRRHMAVGTMRKFLAANL